MWTVSITTTKTARLLAGLLVSKHFLWFILNVNPSPSVRHLVPTLSGVLR